MPRRRLRRLLAGPLTSRAPAPFELCAELRDAVEEVPARTDGCEGCRALGVSWTHLRKCLACGHVGCCDSDPYQHATAHWRETGHPVMRSYEAGERWRWCYEHHQLG